jgi:hypothetical protein
MTNDQNYHIVEHLLHLTWFHVVFFVDGISSSSL